MAQQDTNEKLMVVAAVADERSREWQIDALDYESEEAFRTAVAEELARFEHVGYRLGRGIVAAPIRQQGPTGNYFTSGWAFREVFVPAAKTVQDDRPAIEEPAAEPVIVG